MGCDIHICTEARKSVGGEMRWVNIDHFKLNNYYNEEAPEDGEREWELVPIYDRRDYALFSILADVRNHSNNVPISKPKGIPDDCSKVTRKEIDYWGVDGHSHSYLTLRELLEYLETYSTVKYSGKVSKEQAEDLDKYGIKPDSWCQGTNNPEYVYREWTERNNVLDALIDGLKKRVCDEFWIYDWEKDKEAKIRRLMDKVRIVFWFDN